jgi:uncharacterized protein (DUF1330 family)
VKNEEGSKPYAEANAAIFKKFKGRFLVLGEKFDAMEGHSRTRNVLIEFPDYASALACYRSPEYQENIKVRLPHKISIAANSALIASPKICGALMSVQERIAPNTTKTTSSV